MEIAQFRLFNLLYLTHQGKEDFFPVTCLLKKKILLGDPGAGKTHTFKAAASIGGVDSCTVREFLTYPGTPGKKKIKFHPTSLSTMFQAKAGGGGGS